MKMRVRNEKDPLQFMIIKNEFYYPRMLHQLKRNLTHTYNIINLRLFNQFCCGFFLILGTWYIFNIKELKCYCRTSLHLIHVNRQRLKHTFDDNTLQFPKHVGFLYIVVINEHKKSLWTSVLESAVYAFLIQTKEAYFSCHDGIDCWQRI